MPFTEGTSHFCTFQVQIRLQDVDDKLDIFITMTNKQLQEVQTEMKAAIDSKSIISRLENELKSVREEMFSKATEIASLKAERDAAKIAQSQAESQIQLVKALFEKLDFQHNQTCIAKTEELRQQLKVCCKNCQA